MSSRPPIQPLIDRVPIVNADGTPTEYFIRYLQERGLDISGNVPNNRRVDTDAPLTGGGTLAQDLTLGLADSAVAPGTYGNATNVPQITVDQKGLVQTLVNVPIVTGGDVVGPASSRDEAIARFDGITGKLLQDGGVSPAGAYVRDTGQIEVFIYTQGTAGFSGMQIQSELPANNPGFRIRSHGDTTNAIPMNALFRLRGTIAAPTLVLANDGLGGFAFRGYNGTSIVNGCYARIDAFATQDANLGGSRITFSTVPNGGGNANLLTRLTIDQDGFCKAAVGVQVPDVAYSAAWDGDVSVPTKNAIYDKIQTLGGGGGGGGGQPWALIDSWDFAVSGAITERIVDVSNYTDVLVMFDDVTTSVSTWRVARFSLDGGVTYVSTGNVYRSLGSTGTVTNADNELYTHATASAAARSTVAFIKGVNVAGAQKEYETARDSGIGVFGTAATATLGAITHVRLFPQAGGGATFNGGRIYVIGRPKGTPPGLVLVQEQVVGAATPVIVFAGIPAGYKDLVLVYEARGSAVAANVEVRMNMNGDNAANYDWQRENRFGQGSGFGAGFMEIGSIPAASSPVNYSGSGNLDIVGYSKNVFNKHVSGNNSLVQASLTNAQVLHQDINAWWRNTATIGSLSISLSSGNFVTGSIFALYART